jgi:acyl transferase domain-containing protein
MRDLNIDLTNIAGITMESISGTPTGVFTGAFGIDYLIQLCRDVEDPPPYAALGLGISMLANRLSWFFNLRGPSVGMDSACSSTAMALNHACQSLRGGACSTVSTTLSSLRLLPHRQAVL